MGIKDKVFQTQTLICPVCKYEMQASHGWVFAVAGLKESDCEGHPGDKARPLELHRHPFILKE